MSTDTRANAGPMREVLERLAEARRMWRTVTVGRGVFKALALVLMLLLAGVVLDNLLALPRGARAALSLVFIGASAHLVLTHIIRPLVRALSDEMVATHVERAYPELENCLINAVQLGREQIADPLTRGMVAGQLGETARAVEECDVTASSNPRALLGWGVGAALLVVLTAGYAFAFSGHFSNAVQRYAMPQRDIPPLTGTQLSVFPGDAEKLQGEPLLVEAHVKGSLPEKAAVYFDDGQGGTMHRPMPFEGSVFTYRFDNLQKAFRYWVKAGDATSKEFTVTVRARPVVKAIEIAYAYPVYMGLEDRTEVSRTGAVRAPVGTVARLAIAADRPLASARLEVRCRVPGEAPGEADAAALAMDSAAPQLAAAELIVRRDGEYFIHLVDEEGIPNLPLARPITALPDEAPAVRGEEPGRDLAVAPGTKVALLAEALDDYSLRGLTLVVQRRAGEEPAPLRRWDYEGRAKEVREGTVLDLEALGLGPGARLNYYFQAFDGRPGRDPSAGRSRVYQITVVDQTVAEEEERRQREALREVVRRLITMQEANLASTHSASRWPKTRKVDIGADEAARGRFVATTVEALVKDQEGIYSTARRAVVNHTGGAEAGMVDALANITAHEIARAVERLQALKDAASNEAVVQSAQEAVGVQQEIIALLTRLLENARALLAERLAEQGQKDELSEELEDLMSSRERAERMLEQVREFQDEQRHVIEMSKQLADEPVDDFTEGDEKALDEIIEAELEWAKYFQQAATDLSKLPPQDYSLAGMAKEYLEVYSEVLKAADAAQMKAMEIAVPLEDGGLELAEDIETNLEKWLMDTPDREQWKMEDPTGDFDVPMADLPDELEDLVGDLMEEEEELLDEAEDATSGWLDSMDKGAGWDAMDGPISNMTAKGVTGNRLPSDIEIGGRAGEGRTGKSRGQHVEETATGKGGRKTPTRLTPDPFEAGAVKDTSSDPATGSTGGGKVSGAGQEGLHGPIPPALQDKLKRLASQQRQLIDEAQRLDFGLKKYRYPRGRLPSTIGMMEQIQQELEAGGYVATAGRREKTVLSNLRELKELVDKQKEVRRDRSALLPKELRDEISSGLKEEVPQQYREMVESYFRALSEAGSAR